MARNSKETHFLFLLTVGLFSWLIPGGGYFLLKEKKRAIIIFAAITLTFCTGLYIGSIGVIDPVGSKFPYAGQLISSPVVAIIGYHTSGGGYNVYGKPREIGQLYTGLAGMLNLLCIINAIYLAHLRRTKTTGV